ncbi:hypothetical protein [Streptomyces albicerus]|uniref:hypothetical protein n=1 Tax=Streptomyces albicerus TaxID=2569859 RepID=UPI00124BB389|nr:hypothetical protein [Streptomyces albicerus]
MQVNQGPAAGFPTAGRTPAARAAFTNRTAAAAAPTVPAPAPIDAAAVPRRPVQHPVRARDALDRKCVEDWNSANTVLHYGKDGALTGRDKEHAETSI